MKLESLLIDTKNKKFEVNGENISDCHLLQITYSSGEWTVNVNRHYFSMGEFKNE